MDISVIVCTWNNSGRLEITLDAIAKCIIPEKVKWEIILINNNCTDNTDYIASKFANSLPLRYVKELHSGKSFALNRALAISCGKLIIFGDDDIRPCKEWICEYWFAYKRKAQGYYFGGPLESEFENQEISSELTKYAPPSVRGLDWGGNEHCLSSGEYFVGANWACPLEYLRVVGGFDVSKNYIGGEERIKLGEDTNIMKRLIESGFSPWYLPKAKVSHYVPSHKISLRHIAERRRAYGYYVGEHDTFKQCPCITGIPRWMYKKLFILWTKWILAKLQRKKGYEFYLGFQELLGNMKGIRDNLAKQHSNI